MIISFKLNRREQLCRGDGSYDILVFTIPIDFSRKRLIGTVPTTLNKNLLVITPHS